MCVCVAESELESVKIGLLLILKLKQVPSPSPPNELLPPSPGRYRTTLISTIIVMVINIMISISTSASTISIVLLLIIIIITVAVAPKLNELLPPSPSRCLSMRASCGCGSRASRRKKESSPGKEYRRVNDGRTGGRGRALKRGILPVILFVLNQCQTSGGIRGYPNPCRYPTGNLRAHPR